MSRTTLPEQLLSLVLAAAFLAASGGNPYGLHDCPHHDPVPAQTSDRPAAGDEEPGAAVTHDASTADGSQHSGGPCTCVGDCHASATTPVPLAGPDASAAVAAGTSESGAVDGTGRLTGHRHLLFELHLPNAPPLASPGSFRAGTSRA